MQCYACTCAADNPYAWPEPATQHPAFVQSHMYGVAAPSFMQRVSNNVKPYVPVSKSTYDAKEQQYTKNLTKYQNSMQEIANEISQLECMEKVDEIRDNLRTYFDNTKKAVESISSSEPKYKNRAAMRAKDLCLMFLNWNLMAEIICLSHVWISPEEMEEMQTFIMRIQEALRPLESEREYFVGALPFLQAQRDELGNKLRTIPKY